MIPVSIQIRQALGKLVLPLLLLLSIGIIIVGQADRKLADRVRMVVADGLSPFWTLVSTTQERTVAIATNLREAGRLARENARLKTENENLRRWYDVAVSLTRENDSLKTALHWIPEPAPAFVTGRVVADTGGIYARAVLLVAGTESGVEVGNIALASNGLAGRVTETGAHSARILLITDIASRLPVMLEGSHAPAIMVGDNSPMPRLMYYAQDTRPVEGERVVTSDQAGAFPAGLPIGTVHYVSEGRPVVAPFAQLDHLNLLRVFNFGHSQVEPPDAPGHVPLAPPHKAQDLPFKNLLGQG
ncbi:rod shape-determining protein MreC [Acetobacter orientalis]|uniref:Cell shape-determining protein MreC n=1 Tax=Acetobacter orientalis TaxID=146474 RepID=A0A252AZT8_9PROT|nr:rod shape-determining protein MreC [Acetobacter orientalis]MCP1215227.1 rod shape-determining protein MreC [Acetobacter orientalis]MCP1218810.1 rod shape-determining protein MreC [Acetobacter orientalis]MCP1221837.1 rod shape-determining protein MreC [Acetobacter orientalis]OUI97622.1 rod shape-determining protein MreC [Acetobacter orientalis]BBC80479.1 rod shape-determining protein MreC [Acetobacter orientalis]